MYRAPSREIDAPPLSLPTPPTADCLAAQSRRPRRSDIFDPSRFPAPVQPGRTQEDLGFGFLSTRKRIPLNSSQQLRRQHKTTSRRRRFPSVHSALGQAFGAKFLTSEMAPKKGKGKAIVNARKGGEHFVNKEARDRWEVLKAIPFIYKRGFAIEKRIWSEISDDQILALGWQCLCHPRTEAVLPWVQEFYANAMFSEGDDVLVRGRMVNFSYTTINAMFELDDDAINPYEALQASAPRDEIKFNIGILLNKAIKHKARDEKVKCLWFPTLITELCKNAGVEAHPEDVITPVRRHITERVVQVNIRVAKETTKRKKNSTTALPGQYTRPQPRPAEPITIEVAIPAQAMEVLMKDVEYLKTYQRHQHVYFDDRLDYICNVQAQLMHKAKLPMSTPSYMYSGNFDSRGYLMTTGRTRLDTAYDENDPDDIPEEDALEDYLDDDNDDDYEDDDDDEED